MGPDPAKGAFTTGFLLGKIKEVARHIYHTGILIHHHHTPGTHHGACLYQGVKINGRIQKLFRQAASGRATNLYCLKFLFVRYTATYIKNEGPECHSHGNLHQTCMNDIPNNRKNGGPWTFVSTNAPEPGCAMFYYRWDGGQGLHIVDNCRLPPQALLDGVRGTMPGHSSVPLNGLYQGRFLATHKGPGPLEHINFQIKRAAKDPFPQ